MKVQLCMHGQGRVVSCFTEGSAASLPLGSSGVPGTGSFQGDKIYLLLFFMIGPLPRSKDPDGMLLPAVPELTSRAGA